MIEKKWGSKKKYSTIIASNIIRRPYIAYLACILTFCNSTFTLNGFYVKTKFKVLYIFING